MISCLLKCLYSVPHWDKILLPCSSILSLFKSSCCLCLLVICLLLKNCEAETVPSLLLIAVVVKSCACDCFSHLCQQRTPVNAKILVILCSLFLESYSSIMTRRLYNLHRISCQERAGSRPPLLAREILCKLYIL